MKAVGAQFDTVRKRVEERITKAMNRYLGISTDPKSGASANFATLAIRFRIVNLRLAIANDARPSETVYWQPTTLRFPKFPDHSPSGPKPSNC